jgi:hypothetical protein
MYPDIGQPCSGAACAGEHPYCPDCDAAVEEFERDRWAAYYATISLT